MKSKRIAASAALVAALLLILAASSPAAAQRVNPQALALSHFQERVKAYLALRDEVKAKTPPPRPTEDAAELVARQERLAEAVRQARADAKAGDIFIPEVVPFLRRAVAADLRARPPKQRAAALQQVPAGPALRVNDAYPKSVPLATVPPKLLAALPQLPDGLEYRFIGRRLILHDTVANLVVDILDEALPRR